MSVEVRIDPGRIARLLRLRGGVAERGLRRRTERVANLAERKAPGSMGDYVSWTIEQGPKGLQGVVTCDHPAVRFVLDGTRPHVIRPRRAKALRFDMGGRMVFAKKVNHPGTRANNFLEAALREGR
ncbi:hypothetical protein J7E96_19440 [Streptomyces sp. ISL-96]|uniref:hypothetical protein n=1 Tax=Streptomyces sp. ISL-96 TaxID=2819191 RepID=UPI001BEC6A73|nr:hypothetical protein [Streptomyces sp. ISL-96]MBT2490649.1 hypothetical protein [Streptomyces sp. ISL-96]